MGKLCDAWRPGSCCTVNFSLLSYRCADAGPGRAGLESRWATGILEGLVAKRMVNRGDAELRSTHACSAQSRSANMATLGNSEVVLPAPPVRQRIPRQPDYRSGGSVSDHAR